MKPRLILEFDDPAILEAIRRDAVAAGAVAVTQPDVLEERLILECDNLAILEMIHQEAVAAGVTVIEYPAVITKPEKENTKT